LTAVDAGGAPDPVGDPARDPAPGADPALAPLSPARLEAAAALRRLGHAVVGHEVTEDVLRRVASSAQDLLAAVESSPPRRRPATGMSRNLFTAPPPEGGARGSHFPDCIVTGPANPMGLAARTVRDGEDAVVYGTLGAAFEGAPDRAHGGVVAAMFDEAFGFVLSIQCTPAFTGRLTVRYRAPVPMGVELEFRARLTRRDGRKLYMTGQARHDDTVLADAEALFVAVDPELFAAGA
jgi:acyl-coenzyme A thioesterase PaaI-like protein